MTDYHIAQVNIGRMVAPIDSETMYGFTSRLDEINALADVAEGFVWRLQTEERDATALRVFDDAMMIINMSVWESIEALHAYTYKSAHVELIRERKAWFVPMETAFLVVWWIPAGHIPTTDEAKAKLLLLTEQGASPMAFTFSKRFTVEEMLAAQVSG